MHQNVVLGWKRTEERIESDLELKSSARGNVKVKFQNFCQFPFPRMWVCTPCVPFHVVECVQPVAISRKGMHSKRQPWRDQQGWMWFRDV